MNDTLNGGQARPLAGVRVVDLGVGMAPALAAKLLVEAGAEVIRFEPSGGDPFYEAYPAYEVWQRGKTVAVSDDAAVEAALARAEICILGGEDYPGLQVRRDAQALHRDHPGVVILDISASPDVPGEAGLPAVELLAQARSGMVFEHHEDRPIMFAFPAASYGAALHGLAALLAALLDKRRNGRGAVVSTSLLQGALGWCGGVWAEVETSTPSFAALIPKDVVDARFQCADGEYIHFTPGVPGSYYKLHKVLGIDDPSIDPNARGIPTGGDPKRYFGDMARTSRHAAELQSDVVIKGLNDEGLPAERVLAPGAVWDNPQVDCNRVLARDEAGRSFIGSPISLHAGCKGKGPPSPAAKGEGPLAGVRIVDLGSFAAGPYSSTLLGDLGADVIKLERPEGDPMRASFHHYSASNRGKRTIAVDAKAGAEVIARICASADVVHHNFRPGISAKLGVDAAALSKLNPRAIVLEASAYGFEGPLAHLPGFDPLFQAIAGHQVRAGGEGNPPLYYRFALADYGNGLIGATAIILALLLRERDDVGSAAFVNLLSSAMFLMSELVREADGQFRALPQMSADHLGFHPAESLYQTADGWIAITARDEAMAARLGEITRAPAAPKADWGEAQKAAIASWTAARPSAAILADLAQASIWSAACASSVTAAFAPPVWRDLGMVAYGRTDASGAVKLVGRAATVSTQAPASPSAARLAPIGEHTREILAECGFAPAEVEALYQQGVVA